MSVYNGPGVYPDMSDAEYLSDPVEDGSLSASGVKTLLECPALFHHRQQTGEQHRDYFDFGKAAHAALLGRGADVVVIDHPDWRKKEAKEAKEAAYAAGQTPVLAHQWAQVEALVNALDDKVNAEAKAVLNMDGPTEVAAFWHDRVMRRAKFDKYSETPSGRTVVIDYKTNVSADPRRFDKSAANFGYFMADAWYRDAARHCLGADDPAFLFVVQMNEPPYLATVVELTESFRRIGEWRNERAVDIYMECKRTGEWPGYVPPNGFIAHRVSAPRWLEIEHEEQIEQHREGM